MPQSPSWGPPGGPGGPTASHPEYIGSYHILQVLGAGGMGIVYVAEQTTPVRRRVALKVIKLGMGSPAVVARFENERQALAMMEHPNIAQVFDGGVTDDGRPYLVMELVKGIPITDYCDRETLSTGERLAVFMDVCRAVQHAHQKGVLHRDLKPSNLLVMLQDGKPVPKVIDFGVAKALAPQLAAGGMVTQVGETVGTPAYMSPEQAGTSALDVDTRTDIYSLGVVLFELLVGRLPVDPDELGLIAFMAQLASGETSPARPSAKLATLGTAAATVSTHRRTERKVLERELRGDLDWIVMKAMDPKRARRYETVNALVVDIERYLKSEPVEARPPSTLYRLSRFVRRNRTAVTAGGLVVAALVVGLSIAAAGLVKARAAEAVAQRQAAESQQVAAFLKGLFNVSNPNQAKGNTLTARQILDSGAARLRKGALASQPLVQADMQETIGIVYREIGLYEDAEPLLREAVATRSRLLPADDSSLQASILELGHLDQRQAKYAEAESLYRRTLATRERAFGPNSPQLVAALSSLGGLSAILDRRAQAESLLVRALEVRMHNPAPDDDEYAELLRNLAAAELNLGKFGKADSLLRRALTMYTRLDGANSPSVARTLSNIGVMYYYMGKYDQAEQYYLHAESIFTKTLGANNPNIASVNINLGETDWRQKRYEEAEQRLDHAMEIVHKSMDPGSPAEGTAQYDLGNVLRDMGRPKEAEPHYQRALKIREAGVVSDSSGVAEVLTGYAKLLRQTGRTAEAKRMETRAKAILDTSK